MAKKWSEDAEEYGIDLCAYCRECEGEKPCQHKIDAMHGYQDGLKAREKAMQNLQKENAELKDMVKEMYFLLRNYDKFFLGDRLLKCFETVENYNFLKESEVKK